MCKEEKRKRKRERKRENERNRILQKLEEGLSKYETKINVENQNNENKR